MSISITKGRTEGAGDKTTSFVSTVSAAVGGLVARVRESLELSRMRAELETLDDRALADIGVYRNGKIMTIMRPGANNGRFPEIG
jgi:uncharacterized protein YjiS (DUF1127 family)